MLDALQRLSNQLPPRLKSLLNLTITVVLVVLAGLFLWAGIASRSWSDAALGGGLLLLGVFNLFT
jgi:TRAP-type C4-dicarboxylate transport system permease small subunit